MKNLRCATVRRQISAFCDGELPFDEQLAIEAHLQGCDACRAEADLMRELGDTLRATSVPIGERETADLAALQAALVPRVKAERTASLAGEIEALFEDMHLVWAAACGIAAVIICGALLFSMLHDSSTRPDSLAALMETLSREPVRRLQPEPLVLRAHPDAVMPAMMMNQQSGDDAVYALAAVMMEDGSLSEIELLQPEGQAAVAPSARQTRDLLDAASTARFEPARQAGAPVSVNMVWVLTHTTVRGKPRTYRAKVEPVAPVGRPVGSMASPEPNTLESLLPDAEIAELARV